MFVSVSFVRMPPLNWGGDSDEFYRATYGPALRGADGLRRAVYGHVSRITEGRPRFSHGLVFFWDTREAWEAAKRRPAGMPPLPRAAQGLETYAGEFEEIAPPAVPGSHGMIGVWLLNVQPDAPATALADYAVQARGLTGVRGVWTGSRVLVEGGDAPKARSGVLLLEFEGAEDAERSLRPERPAAVRPLQEWATDIEPVYFDLIELPVR